jgi:titin
MTSDSVIVEWNAPADAASVSHFEVQYKDSDSLTWQTAARVKSRARSCTVSGLRENRQYFFRVIAINQAGYSDPLEGGLPFRSSYREAQPPHTPGGPLVVTDIQKNSLTLVWQPPPYDGGAPVSDYIIEMRDTTVSTGWSRVDRVRAHIHSYTITHLYEDRRYYFRVIAENSSGRSHPLETRRAVTTHSPFSMHTIIVHLVPP